MSSSAMGMDPTEVRQGKGKGKAQKQRPTMVSPYFSESLINPLSKLSHTI